ncbi:Telomerase protein component 1 [Didymella heteroderae]|uniref:phosphatidylinositol-3,4,5-trisphosphate 3-phosphatase n=1 Tax=Didymella heteroderae TaxID=1769908 RepID=A0A9P5C7S5_9PLEO|nr:Telomerase protein component 1 [Didymella heteroderae]
MASILRQIVAGPRARHAEAGLDLCYVTDNSRDWAIWEFRAEGTGYPDSEVYNRVYHYPFPDHHPPPFALIPNIMASMRNWLKAKEGRVVVVHCKAGKGRSGTASCSYLMSEEGWPMEKALQRFTERRMRPGMGYKGVSIPSQLRWLTYVDRWTKYGKMYVERQVEVLEVHCWGLRDGVKIQIEGFIEDGKLIKNFHTFAKEEREIVRGEVKTTGMAQAVHEVMYKNGLAGSSGKANAQAEGKSDSKNASRSSLETPRNADDTVTPRENSKESLTPGTGDVVFRPSKRVVLPTNDINIDVERRNKAAFDLTMVTAVAHVWFNTFFEGNGAEKNGTADESGVFEIDWDAMDGIKGSSRKGTQAFERIAVVWRALSAEEGQSGVVITEPKEGEEVRQTGPTDWKGTKGVEPSEGKDLGLRSASPDDSELDISRTEAIKSANEQNKTTVPVPGRRNSDASDDSDTKDVRSLGPNGEEVLQYPTSTRTSMEASGKKTKSPETTSLSKMPGHTDDAAVTSSRPASRESHRGTRHVEKLIDNVKYHVSGATSTGELHDGRLESEMKNTKEHQLGHLGKNKLSN